MANIKISQLPAKGANLGAQDLVEVAEFTGTGYVSKSITGAEIIAAAGGVTSVSGTAPIASTGGATPTISIATADTTTTGALTSTDWNTFNGKQAALVSGTNIKTINGNSVLGSGNVAVQPTLVSGTNIKTINGSSILGTGDLVVGGGGGASGIHTILKGGGSLFGGVETSNLISSANLSSYTCQPNQMAYFPYVPNNDFTSTSLSFNVTSATAGAKCKLYIYSHDGINGPNSRLYESAEIDLSTTGSKTILTTFSFTKGTVYWFGIFSNIFGPNISAMNTQGGALPVCWIGTTQVLSWVQVSLTYPTAPTTAGPNSFTSSAPLIRLK